MTDVGQQQTVKVVVQNFADKKIKKKFDGSSSFAQWKLTAEQLLERIKEEEKQLWTLMDALEGNALNEIQRHQASERDSATKVFSLLEAKYADRRTATQVRRQFYATLQLPGQSVLEYGDAVAESLDGTAGKLGLKPTEIDAMMRDQFAENVSDPMLRWELRKAAQEQNSTFDKIRELALEWESGQTQTKTRAGPKSPAACYATESRNDEMAALRQMITSQQEQINALTLGQTELLETLKSNQSQSGQKRESRTCFYCGAPGHLAYDCRKKKRDHRYSGQTGGYDRRDQNHRYGGQNNDWRDQRYSGQSNDGQQQQYGGQENDESLQNPQQGRR